MNTPVSSAAQRKGRLLIIATALLWGLAGVCVKSITWNSMSIMAIRSLVTLIMLGVIRRSLRFKLTKNNLFGALMMSLTGILYMMGIKNTDAATAIVLQYTAPIFVLLFSVIFKHTKPSWQQIAIVAVVFFGCALSFADKMGEGKLLGNVLSLASGVTFALQIICFSLPDTDGDDSIMIGAVLSILVCTPFMFFDKAIPETDGNVVFWLVILCIFQYGLANIFYSRGSHLIPDVECSLLLTLEPIFNPIPVAIVCGEFMGPLALAGFVVVIFGIVAYTLITERDRRRATKRE